MNAHFYQRRYGASTSSAEISGPEKCLPHPGAENLCAGIFSALRFMFCFAMPEIIVFNLRIFRQIEKWIWYSYALPFPFFVSVTKIRLDTLLLLFPISWINPPRLLYLLVLLPSLFRCEHAIKEKKNECFICYRMLCINMQVLLNVCVRCSNSKSNWEENVIFLLRISRSISFCCNEKSLDIDTWLLLWPSSWINSPLLLYLWALVPSLIHCGKAIRKVEKNENSASYY